MMLSLLMGVVGSTAYGLAHSGSDIDRLGVYAAPTTDFFGLREPEQTLTVTKPDITMHEVGKAVRLMLTCNPTITELLWLPEDLYEISTPLGEELIELRSAFLSAPRVRDAYFGYARSQFEKLRRRSGGPFTNTDRALKNARHLVRLIQQGEELYRTGRLTIRLSNPDEVREMADRIVANPNYGEFLLEAKLSQLGPVTVLPDQPATAHVEAWLVHVRHHFYKMGTM